MSNNNFAETLASVASEFDSPHRKPRPICAPVLPLDGRADRAAGRPRRSAEDRRGDRSGAVRAGRPCENQAGCAQS